MYQTVCQIVPNYSQDWDKKNVIVPNNSQDWYKKNVYDGDMGSAVVWADTE